MSDKNFVWIDLEMTGLQLPKDSILEIATIITDSNLNIIAQGPALVIHQSDELLATMDDWNVKHHTKSGLVDQVRASQISIEQAAEKTLEFIMAYCQKNTGLLAGNSVWQDRAFLNQYMPSIIEYLNYRLIDISSVKELVRRWYPNNPKAHYKKPETHRALDDIKASIEELAYYRENFFHEPSIK
jgi:oligoribonuclease